MPIMQRYMWDLSIIIMNTELTSKLCIAAYKYKVIFILLRNCKIPNCKTGSYPVEGLGELGSYRGL